MTIETQPYQITVEPVPGMFDAQLIQLFHTAAAAAFLRHGDVLRSVGLVLDYHGGLNNTEGIKKGLWLGPQGQVSDPAAVIGSMQQTLVLWGEISSRALQITGNAQDMLAAVLREIHQKQQEQQHAEQEAKPEETRPQAG
jgi:hypothetical protein